MGIGPVENLKSLCERILTIRGVEHARPFINLDYGIAGIAVKGEQGKIKRLYNSLIKILGENYYKEQIGFESTELRHGHDENVGFEEEIEYILKINIPHRVQRNDRGGLISRIVSECIETIDPLKRYKS